MTTQRNLRTDATDWMRSHPFVVEAVSAVLGGGLGALLCGGLGFWLIDWQAGIGLTVIGGVVGLLAGFFLVQLPMAAVGLLLMIVFPRRRVYLPIACVVGAVGGFVRGQQLGYSSVEWPAAAIVYAILVLIVLEACGAGYTFFQRINDRSARQSEPKEA
ncbi:MAG: hypothetical protein JSS49_10330 [Planctomycetes bacterium]|nr:hypothetical protein [Planctomycetota bacterium]